LFALLWRSFNNQNTLELTETVYRRQLRPFGKTPESLTKIHLPEGMATELWRWKLECKKASPKKPRRMPSSSRTRTAGLWIPQLPVPDPQTLAEQLGIEKLNFQSLRRTMTTQTQKMGSVKDIQAHLRHSRPDATANEYMQELPESSREMVGSAYAMLMKGGERKVSAEFATENATDVSEKPVVSD
jgi:hypothetical protein